MIVRTGMGQKSRRFLPSESAKPCVVAGEHFEGVPGLSAYSDGDPVYQALCNAIASLTGVAILEEIAEELLQKDGITDSKVYLESAVERLGKQKVTHVSVALEAKRPIFHPQIQQMRSNIAGNMNLDICQVGITACSGEGLTDFGCGAGIQALCVVTTVEE